MNYHANSTEPTVHDNTVSQFSYLKEHAQFKLDLAFALQNVVGLGILLANTLILVVLSRYKNINKSTHDLFKSLAIADIALGVATFLRQGLLVTYNESIEEMPLRCAPAISLFVASAGCSISSLLFVAIEQWYVSTRSLTFEQKKRKGKYINRCIKISWSFFIALGLCAIPATKSPGTFRIFKSTKCLVGGLFIENAYWQFVFNTVIAMSISTVLFQFLGWRSMRTALSRLILAVEQRHQPFMIAWEVNSPQQHRRCTCARITTTTREMSQKAGRRGARLSPIGGFLSTTTHGSYEQAISGPYRHLFQNFSEDVISPYDQNPQGAKPHPGGGDSHELLLAKTKVNLSKTLALVMGLFAGSWLLYLPAATILANLRDEAYDSLRAKQSYLALLPLLNSIANAIVYPLRLKGYRQTMTKLFFPKKMFRSRKIVPSTSANLATAGELPFQALRR